MSDYGHGVCIDCEAHSPRLLPERFPHICQACLFPPPKRNEQITKSAYPMKGPSIIEALHAAAAKAPARFMRSEFGAGEWS